MEPLNPESRELRPLAEYTRRLPSSRAGRRLNRATLWRWALRGVREGRKLRTVVLGAGRMTCDAWVWEFLVRPEPDQLPAHLDMPLDAAERARIARELGAAPERKTA